MPYFPLFVDLTDRPCRVVGGGAVAERRVRGLLDFGPRITVIAPAVTEALRGLFRRGRIDLWERPYGGPADLEGAALVIAATGDAGVNGAAARDARSLGIPVNTADRRELCSFFFPALVRRGELVGGISTSGRCPRLSARLREGLEEAWPQNLGDNLNYLENQRNGLREGGSLGPPEVAGALDPLISRALEGEALG